MSRSSAQAVWAIVWTAALLMPLPVAAQERTGFVVGFGGGYGSSGIACDDACQDTKRANSGVGYLKLGWTLTPRVVVGGEVNFWTKSETEQGNKATVNLYSTSVTVTYYLRPDDGFFVKAGGGGSFIDTELDVNRSRMTLDLGTGPGVLLGAGYDFSVSRRVKVTPAFNFWYGWPGDLRILGQTGVTGWKQGVWDVTLGLTFY